MADCVYFDQVATTRPHPGVVDAMLPYLRDNFANPASLHQCGRAVRQAVEGARREVADLLGAGRDEIVFTSCGSEGNNLALKGAALAGRRRGNHIVASCIEHYSVLHPLKNLGKMGFEVTYLPVDGHGMVDPRQVADAIREQTVLVSVMHGSNEIGTLQPIAEIGEITRSRGIVLHSDAVHTVGKIPLDVAHLQVDLLTLAGHHFYGPKGSGALYVRKGTRVLPLIEGGLQEDGRRAGTLDVPAIVGLGRAASLAKEHQEQWSGHARALALRLREALASRFQDIVFTGHPERRLPGHLSMCLKFIEGEGVLLSLDMEGFAVASGSACISQALKSSYVLEAIGIDAATAQGSLLVSLGKDNSADEVDRFVDAFVPIIERLRAMSPLCKKQA